MACQVTDTFCVPETAIQAAEIIPDACYHFGSLTLCSGITTELNTIILEHSKVMQL